MIVDYHMHLRDASAAISHSRESVTPFVETALARGIDEIGFTEHVYYFHQTAEIWQVPYMSERCTYDLEAYCDAVLEAKREGLPVKLGVEVDYVGERQARLTELLAPYPFDFRLGSVHWLGELAVDMSPGAWDVMTVDEVWQRYVDALCELTFSGAVDALAHPDLAKIFGRRPRPELLAELHERVALAVGAAGLAVEVSTAGLRKPVGELYPDVELLRACARKGAPITLASDAHEPALVGEAIGEAVALARDAGCETVAVFEGGTMSLAPLG
ncbi:MAG TPA: histidinol-phosphatase HisJ family protein [Gaiellaceae bacterium]|nr:histidinol-phosphatase HisJ family protein [Gaiellaceae bacterium]